MQPERDFAAWLDRRDAEALGRVFDACGGKLLLLATHLAGSGLQAQDLVQSTFVAAMAHGASWDRTRPLWPWLAAILQNELRMQRRSGRRRREVALDTATEPHAAMAEPPSLVASEELLGKVLAAIDGMPLPYRQVLRLRLVHGLRPVDIARSLEVPVGTVRAQLHRGLEQLRGVLPTGVAGVLAVLLVGDGALLAQVRARVLEHAAAGAGAATIGAGGAMVFGGWLSMHGKLVVGAGAAMALLLVLVWMVGGPEWLTAASPAPGSVAPVRADAPRAGDAASAPPAPAARRTAAASDDVQWPLVVIVQTHDGAAIAGADVTVATTPPGSVYWNRDASDFGQHEIAAGTTGADGVFRTSLDGLRAQSTLANRTTRLWIESRWPHAAPSSQLVDLPRTPDPQQVTVTIELRRHRVVITGRAVDAAGVPVARALVGTSRPGGTGADQHAPTRADGSFCVALDDDFVANEDLRPDRLFVAAPAHGTASVPLPAFRDGSQAIDVGPVVLQAGPAVRGRTVLGDGSALAGIQLQVQEIDPSLGDDLAAIHRWLMNAGSRQNQHLVLQDGLLQWRSAQTNTLADGSFCFAGLRPDGVYLLSVWAVGAPADTVVRPGAEPITLRIDKQLLAIDVFDEQGAAVPGAQVRLAGYDPAGKHPSYEKWPGFPETGQVCSNWLPSADPTGRRIVLAPFGFVFRVTVADDSVQPVAVRHDVLPGVYHASCRLDLRTETRFGRLQLCAVDETGAPIGFGPILKAIDRDLQINGRRLLWPPEGHTWQLPAGQWRVEAVLGKEVVYLRDEGGYARGCQEHVVTVEEGRTTSLKLVAPPAGLVAFDVSGDGAPIPSWRTLRVETAGREFVVIGRDPADPRPPGADARVTQFVGKQALPPGRHSFLLQADGFQPARCEVDIVADRLTPVRVVMFVR